MGKAKDSIVVAVEFGTDKIAVIYGRPSDANKARVLAFASQPSDGCVQKGEIIDQQKAEKILVSILSKANEQCPDVRYYCRQVNFLVNGSSVISKRGCGELLFEESKTITDQDRQNAIDKVEIESIDGLQQFNSFYSFYTLDDATRVSDPVGHNAQKLSAYLQLLYADEKLLTRMGNILKNDGFDFCDEIKPDFCGAASAMSVITDEEEQTGVLAIDFGRGSCNYILVNGSGAYTCGNIPVGTDHIANDLSLGLHLDIDYCRKFLNEHKLSQMTKAKENALRMGNRQIMLSDFEKIIDARIRETFQFIYKRLHEKNVQNHFTSGVVLTGGGAELDHVQMIATDVFKSRVRIGEPIGIENLPQEILDAPTRYAALTGMLKISCNELYQSDEGGQKLAGIINTFTDGVIDRVINCFKRKKQAE